MAVVDSFTLRSCYIRLRCSCAEHTEHENVLQVAWEFGGLSILFSSSLDSSNQRIIATGYPQFKMERQDVMLELIAAAFNTNSRTVEGKMIRRTAPVRLRDSGRKYEGQPFDFFVPAVNQTQDWLGALKCGVDVDKMWEEISDPDNVAYTNTKLPDFVQVSRLSLQAERLCITLNRPLLMRFCIGSFIESDDFLSPKKTRSRDVIVSNAEIARIERTDQLSFLRCSQARLLVSRLLTFRESQGSKKAPTRATIGCADRLQGSEVHFRVGVVTAEGETTSLLRAFERTLLRYKAIAKERENFDTCEDSIMSNARLSAANDIQFQLFSKSLSLPCKLASSLSDYSFVMYNYVRLCHIFRAFRSEEEFRVEMPSSTDQIDFTLLKEEEEWELVIRFLWGYKDLLSSTVVEWSRGHLAVHKLFQFTTGIAKLFSRYYNRVHILRKPFLPNRRPTTFARLALLRAVDSLFTHAFRIMGLTTLRNM